jgi:hypothetical protein
VNGPRIDNEAATTASTLAGGLQMPAAAIAPVGADADVALGNDLPSDHPPWPRDTLSISQRARALLAHVKPVVIRVIAFWEHRVRSIVVAGRTLSVDASGSYRLD